MSQVIQQKIAEARQALDAANANLASNQSQTAQLQAAVTSAQQRVDELTQLDAAVDAEYQTAQQPVDTQGIDPSTGQPYTSSTPAVDANGQPIDVQPEQAQPQ